MLSKNIRIFFYLALTAVGIFVVSIIDHLPGPASLSDLTLSISFLFKILSAFAVIIFLPFLVWLVFEIIQFYKKKTQRVDRNVISCFVIVSAFCFGFFFSGHMDSFSRAVAIKNAAPLITAIEVYNDDLGEYPTTLDNLIPAYLETIPESGILGIPEYEYERTDGSYEIKFSMNMFLVNWDVVSYSPNNQRKIYSRDDTLTDTGFEHWKYYYVD